ncbi:DNA-processing protein DprA [Patescibacteria group bacterium]|nr:DNA-processing protein DprA [Patescibacteria group bacterium]MBU1663654.1 DNA-processing protein DprA [Patescibacteria group bacterium]MBU1933985.1 DNA-processing protein DprA [Patescibacteria group bacterium]
MNDLKYWLALSQFYKFGPAKFTKLKKYFSTIENAYKATMQDYLCAGIEEKIAEEFIIFKHQVEPDKLLENLNKEKLQALTIEDPAYPKLLKQIYDPPFILYYRGSLEAFNGFLLAVVGTRKYSAYGARVTEKLVRELAFNKLTIVSGMALGIDTLAHAATLEAGGKTIAVLGSGLEQQNIYPSQNRYMADKIQAHGGLILSEYPIGTMPLKHHFPQRNRIISGLSIATLVIEAAEKSGALITAFHALEQNREVFAVPGSIYSSSSEGANRLITMGAKLVASAKDIIETLNLAEAASYIENKKIIPETNEEKLILAQLSYEPEHIDKLKQLTKLDTSIISSTLTIMEMKGMVKNLGNMQYVLAR